MGGTNKGNVRYDAGQLQWVETKGRGLHGRKILDRGQDGLDEIDPIALGD